MLPHIELFERAAAHPNGQTIYNSTGSMAMAHLIRTMAQTLDSVAAQTTKGHEDAEQEKD